MFKKAAVVLYLAFLAAFALARPASAQLLLQFVQPTDVDPTSIALTHKDAPQSATASDLLSGIDLHGTVQAFEDDLSVLRDVTEVAFDFTYAGTVTVYTSAIGGFLPWSLNAEKTAHDGSSWHVVLDAVDGAAPINDNFKVGD